MLKSFYQILWHFIGLLILSSCSYRFSNTHIHLPSDIRTIAIEPIFDTSRLALPHDILWNSLQRNFATDGHLIVSSAKNADIFLRTQIKSGTRVQNNIENFYPDKDPKTLLRPGSQTPYDPFTFQNLNRARKFMKNELTTMLVVVEIWNLKTKKKIFEKTYNPSVNTRIFDSSLRRDQLFLQAQESFQIQFTQMSNQLSKAIIKDFLTAKI